jgi:hypothetical protein
MVAPTQVRIDPGLSPELADAVRGAGPALEKVLGDAASRVEVAWERGGPADDGDPTARLTLTDAGVARSSRFTAWDFADDLRMRRRLRELWIDVLDERLRLQRQKVHESLIEDGEG